MKRSGNTRPYLSWCMIVRNCEEKLPGALEKCLQSLRARTPDAEIVIVDTMSSDRFTPENAPLPLSVSKEPRTHIIAKKYADVFEVYAGPRGDWTEEMLAFDDAAAARNRSFALAHGEILGWIDSDDELLGPEDTIKLLKMNGKFDMPEGSDMTPVSLEDVIHKAFDDNKATEVYCPYLFCKDDQGRAKMWQERERFVKNDGKYCWKSPAHEVLVPVSPNFPVRRMFFPELLFVHNKKWTDTDLAFSTKRHFDIMVKGFDDGSDRNSRTALYLGVQASELAPQRQDEFIQASYDLSGPPTDRYRALQMLARRSADKGFILDAYEQVAAAISIRPDLPEAYLTGAEIASAGDDWARAGQWGDEASQRPVTAECAIVSPRAVAFEAPCHAAYFYLRAARQLCGIASNESWDMARAFYAKACEVIDRTLQKMSKDDPDIRELVCLKFAHDNERDACKHAIALRDLAVFHLRNDEPLRVAPIIDAMPWQFRHSSMVAALRDEVDHVLNHKGTSYDEFYKDDNVTGAIATANPDAPTQQQLLRIQWAIVQATQLAAKLKRPLKVLEVGCFDGNVGIPVMRHLPEGSSYLGVEIQPDAIARFKARLDERAAIRDRYKWEFVEGSDETLATKCDFGTFDLILLYEVIEHVPNTRETLRRLLTRLSPSGLLLVSTPCGAFDRGFPPGTTAYGTPRDSRGHLRAMTARDLFTDIEAAAFGARVVDMKSFQPNPGGVGAELVASARWDGFVYHRGGGKDVKFLVQAALWDWNASHVINTGIGASEETIVYLSRLLADSRKVQVYGPVPTDRFVLDEETRDGVSYWSHAHLREGLRDGTVVVSRSPSWGAEMLKQAKHSGRKILWLQDATYPDLSDEIASKYDKIVVLSQWHKNAMHDRHGVSYDRMIDIPNFLLADQFTSGKVERRPHHFVYAASPDRGLIFLLQMWPRILEAWPDATLDIFYGWTGVIKLGLGQPQWRPMYRATREEYEKLRWQKGVCDRGRVNHAQIAYEMRSAGYWAYPSLFEETGCLNAIKARAAGCTVVAHPLAALAETAACPTAKMIPQWDVKNGEAFENYAERFVGAVIDTQLTDTEREAQAAEAIEKYRLENVAKKWEEIL